MTDERTDSPHAADGGATGETPPPPQVDLSAATMVTTRLTAKFMKQYHVLPLAEEDSSLRLAMADPGDRSTIEEVEAATGLTVVPLRGDGREIAAAVDRLYGEGGSIRKLAEEAEESEIGGEEEGGADVDHLRDMASEAPVIRMVNLIISQAVERAASDIHFEPFENRLVVRYRIDGILHEVESPPLKLQAAVLSRVKIMARMNIAERRLPQDGRIRLRIREHDIDIRVSTVPTIFGESLVLRLLDRSGVLLTLEDLGFDGGVRELFGGMIAKPYGMILVTGPTGSGKTTTLYAALSRINSSDRKIITIEDPVEYQLEGVNQIQVKAKVGLDFASGLRSIVRQDPDVIMVGEIRDRETAEIAIQSALTGHLVFSTVHTNDAAGAVTRLRDMGVENYLISSSVIGILAQRLVRRTCPACAVEDPAQGDLLAGAGWEVPPGAVLRRGAGCQACSNTGYRGRIGIFELLRIDERVRRLIMGDPSADVIRAAGREAGMIILREDGFRKVALGQTTTSEVLRVTREE